MEVISASLARFSGRQQFVHHPTVQSCDPADISRCSPKMLTPPGFGNDRVGSNPADRSPEGPRRAPNGAHRRTALARGRSGRQAQAALRRDRERHRRRLRPDAQGARDRAQGRPRPGPGRRRAGRGCARSAWAEITPQTLKTFARQARKGMRVEGGGYRRDHLRALAQRIEVDAKEVRIMGSKSVLLRTLVAASSAKSAIFGGPSSVPKWRG